MSDRVGALVNAGDSAGAIEFARSARGHVPNAETDARYAWALYRQDLEAALVVTRAPYLRHVLLATLGRLEAAHAELESLRGSPRQDEPRALILQGQAELAMEPAARLAREARREMFYGRSVATVVMLEADARAAPGQTAQADSLYRLVLATAAFVNGDHETHGLLRQRARAALDSSAARRKP